VGERIKTGPPVCIKGGRRERKTFMEYDWGDSSANAGGSGTQKIRGPRDLKPGRKEKKGEEGKWYSLLKEVSPRTKIAGRGINRGLKRVLVQGGTTVALFPPTRQGAPNRDPEVEARSALYPMS